MLDVDMPWHDGFDVYEALKSDPVLACVPVRLVTVSVGVACYDDDSECWVPPSADSCFSDDLRVRCSPIDLVQAADKALYSAKNAGRAQARLLDIADVDTPQLARDIAPSSRKPRGTEWDER